MTMLRLASLEIDDKVYIRDDQFVWLPARLLEKEEERALVKIELPDDWQTTTNTQNEEERIDGQERWVNFEDYTDHQLPMQNKESVRDMAELTHLHEAAILYQIKERHFAFKPYTRVGEIVVAVNPCLWIPGLYSKQQQRIYTEQFVWQVPPTEVSVEEKKDDSLIVASSTTFKSTYDRLGFEPHIYEVSSLAYRGLALDCRNQTILVTGESGAGKTETVKIVVRHLATLETSAPTMKDDGNEESTNRMVRHVLETSPLFEAFGNAKTLRNNNSSRFGKLTRLHFKFCTLQGSTSQTYLLETNRIASHAPGERNFHIFYQFLAASKEFKKKVLGTEWVDATSRDFRYLRESGECVVDGKSDYELWEQTLQALEFFQWSGESLDTLMEALGIVLLLGNIVFGEAEDGNATIASRDDLVRLSKTIGIDSSVIEVAMTQRTIATSQEEVDVPLTPEVAKEQCDALAKKMYATIFSTIVRETNNQTMLPSESNITGHISILDIYGFESFPTNRFDQLCINYASEKLQQKYVNDNLRRCRAEYKAEGIEVFDFKVVDNSDVVDLLEGNSGLIEFVNDECFRPKGTNESFVYKVKDMHKSNSRLIDEKLHHQTQFGISHFAGSVTYDAAKFIERNKDDLSVSLILLAAKSSNLLIRSEFADLVKNSTTSLLSDKVKRSRKATVLERFRKQLRELVGSMEQSQTRYIRCIKPNEALQHSRVDHSTTMRQLKCAGLVTAIDLSRESFPNKLAFEVIEDRFGCLMNTEHWRNLKDMPIHDKVHYMMSTLYAPLIERYRDGNFTMPYACGKTRVYYRAGALEILEALREDFYSARAMTIQRWAMKATSRRRYRLMRARFIRLQALSRAFRDSRMFEQKRRAAVKMQAWIRCLRQSAEHERQKLAASTLQKWFRFINKSVRDKRRNLAATSIETRVRSWIASDRYRRIKLASTSIQAWVRALPRYKQHTALPRSTESPGTVEICKLCGSGVSSQECDQDMRKLLNEAALHQQVVNSLRDEIKQVAAEAESHKQEVEADFEERLADYEEEVLQLKERIQNDQKEKLDLKEEISKAHLKYERSIQQMKKHMQHTQDSHKEYLAKVQSVLECASAARKAETARIRSELQAVKHEKGARISQLEEEVQQLRGLDPQASKRQFSSGPAPSTSFQEAQRLARKVKEATCPERVVEIVKDSEQLRAGAGLLYIEKNIFSKVDEAVSRLVEMVESTEQRMNCAESNQDPAEDDRILGMQQNLTDAYVEIEKLQNELKSYESTRVKRRMKLFKK